MVFCDNFYIIIIAEGIFLWCRHFFVMARSIRPACSARDGSPWATGVLATHVVKIRYRVVKSMAFWSFVGFETCSQYILRIWRCFVISVCNSLRRYQRCQTLRIFKLSDITNSAIDSDWNLKCSLQISERKEQTKPSQRVRLKWRLRISERKEQTFIPASHESLLG